VPPIISNPRAARGIRGSGKVTGDVVGGASFGNFILMIILGGSM